MQTTLRKLMLSLVLAIICGLFLFFWVLNRPERVTQDRVLEWILQGYPSQFCTTIYPKLKDCVTFSVSECESIAKNQVQPCVDKISEQSKQNMLQSEAKKYYLEASVCFEQNMRKHLMGNYLIDSEECRQRMQ